jgi:aryl-alcohol dehydrogenase-like predicted oxidoreductase
MKMEKLGESGPTISRLGIGGWQAGGNGPWGAGPSADDRDAIAAIRLAVELGVTWVDTAASYGIGHSEEVVAQALQPWRIGDDVLVFSKCGHPWDPSDQIRTDLSPDSIRAECEGTLRRLGIERIDLYQFHHPDPAVPVEDSWETMARLVEEGKVRWAGVSNFGVELLERCEAIRHVDCVQTELSLLSRDARRDVIPWCKAHGTGVIVYSPAASGLLARARDQVSLETMSEKDRRFAPAEQILRLTDRLDKVSVRLGASLSALAVGWALAVEGVTGAICGARRPAHIRGWIWAGDVVLDATSLAEIESIVAERSGA